MTKETLKLLIISTAVVLFFCINAFSAEILTGQPLVVIDPGHDRGNPGLENGSGIGESSVTLELADQISALLSDACRVRLTRSAHEPVSQGDRSALANRIKADLYLSLHLSSSAAAHPLIFYFSLPEKTDTDTWQARALRHQPESARLAKVLAASLKTAQPGRRPIILSGPVLPLEGLNMPGALVEPFAITQVPESPDKQEAFLKNQARALAQAVLAFLYSTPPRP